MLIGFRKQFRSCSVLVYCRHSTRRTIYKFLNQSRSNSTMSSTGKDIFWFSEVDSTMDKAKELLTQDIYKAKKTFVVVGDRQTAGRGTRGRSWVSATGNLYMTLVINLEDIPVALTLTPIRIGTFIIRALDKVFSNHDSFSTPSATFAPPLVQLKWPNDVIINGEKVSGVLIEIDGGKMLIGIGCNISTAPTTPEIGPDSGCRAATYLRAHLPPGAGEEGGEGERSSKETLLQLRDFLASEVYDSARLWVSGSSGDSERAVLDDFHLRMDDSWQVLRWDHHFTQGFESGDAVRALRLNSDGTLQVLHKKTNTERTLSAEYLR